MQIVGELCCNKFKIDVASELEQYKTGACRLSENAAVFLDKMSGFDFEELVTDILKRLGYGPTLRKYYLLKMVVETY